jgi:hypothetical protein
MKLAASKNHIRYFCAFLRTRKSRSKIGLSIAPYLTFLIPLRTDSINRDDEVLILKIVAIEVENSAF